jgi:hypothetical protein
MCVWWFMRGASTTNKHHGFKDERPHQLEIHRVGLG